MKEENVAPSAAADIEPFEVTKYIREKSRESELQKGVLESSDESDIL